MRSLWKLILETSGASLISTTGSVATLFITARLLGPEGRGVLVAASGWALLFATMGSLSVGQVLVGHAAGQERGVWLPRAVGVMCGVIGVSVAVIWFGVTVIYRVAPNAVFNNLSGWTMFLAILPVPFLMWNENSRYLLYALDSLRTANLSTVAGAVVSLAGIVVFVVMLRWGVSGALVAALLSAMTICAITAVSIFTGLATVRFEWSATVQMLRHAIQLHFNAVGTYLFTQATVVILNHYRAPGEVGYYQLAIQCLNFALLPAAAVSAVAYGIVTRVGADRAWSQQRLLLAQAVGLSLVAVAAAYVTAPLLIGLLAGALFAPAVPLFRSVVFALVGGTFSAVMASQWIGRGLFWQTSALTLIVGLISLLCDLLLIPGHGMHGAVVSTLVTYAISVVGNGGLALWAERRWRALGRPMVSTSTLSTVASS